MKVLNLLLVFLLASFYGSAQGFIVRNFTAEINISSEGYFDVREMYDIEFTEAKHGIYRDIITRFNFEDENGKVSKHKIYISNIEVPGEKFRTNEIFGKQFGDKINIRIGDTKSLVSGNKHYEIRYRVKNALIFTDELVQLYWNIKPSDWLTVFNETNFTIRIPEDGLVFPANSFVYSGKTGNTEPSTEFEYTYSGNIFSGKSKKNFLSLPGQNITVLVKLPKSLIQEVDFTPPFWKGYGWVGVIGLFFLSIVAFIKIRLRADRITAVTSYYPPPGIDSALAGFLIDNKPDRRDITCLLPYWASQGVIRMEEIPKKEGLVFGDLKFIKLKDLPGGASDYEYNFFNKIFGEKTEVQASNFREGIGETLRLLTNKSEQYYNQNRSKTRKLKLIVLALSWLWAFFCISFFPFVVPFYIDVNSTKFIVFVVINFIFFFVFFPFIFAAIVNKMLAKNQLGKSIMPELLGFYEFIKMADADRLKVLLKEDPYYFEKTMPYAVAFNLLKEWTAKFEGLILQAPDWYRNSSGTSFRFNSFASSFNSKMSATNLIIVKSPSGSSSSSRSSGGGSSGGSAGRGGGGSW